MNTKNAWIYWGCGICFYLYQFILRVSPSVMVDDLMQHFSIDAATMGVLAGLYYKSYALFQIPCGIIADRWGPKQLIKNCFLVCSLGTLLFASGTSLFLSSVGRFLMGLGSIGGLIGTACLIRLFFPPQKLGFMMSLTMTLGCIGALTGGMPLAIAVETIGWQKTLYGTFFLGLILLIISQKILAKAPTTVVNIRQEYTQGIQSILRNSQIWIAAFCALGLYLPLSVFADLWGTSFLMVTCHVPKSQAAFGVSSVYIGLCLGSLGFAIMVEKIPAYRSFIRIGLAGIWIILSLVLSLYIDSFWVLTGLIFVLGIFTGAEMLCFTTACYQMPPAYNGVTVAFVNTITMAAGAILQPFVGYLLDRHHAAQNMTQDYTAQDFQYALSIIVLIPFICWIISFLLKRTVSPEK